MSAINRYRFSGSRCLRTTSGLPNLEGVTCSFAASNLTRITATSLLHLENIVPVCTTELDRIAQG
jgi:hypothetical protein